MEQAIQARLHSCNTIVDEILPTPEPPALQTTVRILAVLIVAALPALASSQQVTATLLDTTSITGELRLGTGMKW